MANAATTQPASTTWRLTLSYDGTDFHGWQVQPGKPTIQGELQAAVGRITGESPLPQGSGRTDAGVHALAQVASLTLQAPIPPENLLRALNRTLPSSIRVSEAAIMPDPAFHARHSAIAKTYEYRILQADTCSPFLARYVYTFPCLVELTTLQEAARIFLGEKDFRSFAASDPDISARSLAADDFDTPKIPPQSTVRTIFASEWSEQTTPDGTLLVYRVRGNGFLHHMVRNLVGTMLDVGRGHRDLAEIPRILAERNRAAAGATAPARGLFLHSVEYPYHFAPAPPGV
ncbi:MAG TPA: tRNA pseudouridine(38-40) synthase TruA [Terracidiphilus sp.]|nr:tRNA pseudouridine(38-40) synthase TruA [Terracidiphilus sp.]